jgi:hypothetical protein
MKREKIELVHGSGNVFRDFGYANGDVEHLKAILAIDMAKMLDRKKLTVRSKCEVVSSEYAGASMGNVELCCLSRGAPPQLNHQLVSRPLLTECAVPRACRDGRLDLAIAQLKIIFHLIGSHDADHGNTVLLQDEILPAVMCPTRNLAQIDARFGDGKPIDCGHR